MDRKTVLHTLGAVAVLLLPSWLWQQPWLALVGVAAVGAGILMLYRDRVLSTVFVVVGLAGAAAEAVAINHGAWTYANPQFLGVPVWLPLLWGIAGVTVVRIERKLSRWVA